MSDVGEMIDEYLRGLPEADLDELFAEEEDEVCPEGTPKLNADFAGYMELEGAVKDGNCKIVYVEDGISKELGCCNLYHKIPAAKLFNCGHCKYEKDAGTVEAGGPGSGCDPEVAKEHGTECGPKKGEDADFYMHEKMGGAQGTNPGGMYKGKDNVYRYVKLYSDPKQSRGEFLANNLYRALGVPTPKSVLFEKDGSHVIGNEQLEGKTFQQMGAFSSEQAKTFMNGFAADVLTGNWDAVGTGKDNVFVNSGSNLIYRMDQGGTFLKRAQGGDKPEHILNDITEVKQFLNPVVNSNYAAVAKEAGVKSVQDLGEKTGTTSFKDQVELISALREQVGGWDKYVADTVPDMPQAERGKIASMLEARTNLMENLVKTQEETPSQPKVAVSKPDDTDKTPSKGRDWSTPNPKLVAGFFRHGTVVGTVYQKLTASEGQWLKISEIKKEMETKFGRSLFNISQNAIKQGGKKSGLWQLEISGDNVRIFLTKADKKTSVEDVSDEKQSVADSYAKKFGELNDKMEGDYSYKKLVGEYMDKMGVPKLSQSAYESVIDSWSGNSNNIESQNLREVAMHYYNREPSGEYVGGYGNNKVIGTAKSEKQAKILEPAALAMKALSVSLHKDTQYVYRNIRGEGAWDIVKAMKEASGEGKTAIPIPLNSLSSWSTNPKMSYAAGDVKIRMKVDPDNVWVSYKMMPYEFLKGESEVIVGVHQPKEVFKFDDISIEGTHLGEDMYKKYHKTFKAQKESTIEDLEWKKAVYDNPTPLTDDDTVYWEAKIGPLDDDWMHKVEK